MAIHLYGSAIDGGLKYYSDIDLLVTVRQPLSQDQPHALMQGLLAQSAFRATFATLRALEVTVVVYAHVQPSRFPPYVTYILANGYETTFWPTPMPPHSQTLT
ncbi:MAG: nucleotidyltransferase domain-containing protein [Neisseriaceae bacterium]|nr:nucleotidyltransferase domain-containing protein [Neisseriaceae bacterium]